MTLAVLASLGTLFAWTLLLVDGGDLNRSGTFWIMVLLVGLWGAPTRIYARWTMLTLSLALFLWPASVGLACVALWISPPGTFPEHASLPWLTGALAATTALSAAGLVCLRRSSLPGGRVAPPSSATGSDRLMPCRPWTATWCGHSCSC